MAPPLVRRLVALSSNSSTHLSSSSHTDAARPLLAAGLSTLLHIAPHKPDDKNGGYTKGWSSLIGIITAIVGNILISFALNTQRYAHIRLAREAADEDARARRRKRVEMVGGAAGKRNGNGSGNGAARATTANRITNRIPARCMCE